MDKLEQAHRILDIYKQIEDKSEFLYVMKNKEELYDSDLELLWHIITSSWAAGFDDNYDL